MIEREQIDGFFASLRDRGVAPDRPMLWEFYFTDHRRPPLNALAAHLETIGYRELEIWEPSAEDDDQELLFLHAERVETLSAAGLDDRCRELEALAHTFGVETFDGFEIGNVDGQPLSRS